MTHKADIKEGDVVVATGTWDGRIRDRKPEDMIGTLVFLAQGSAWVLLPDGEMFIGKIHDVYLANPPPALVELELAESA